MGNHPSQQQSPNSSTPGGSGSGGGPSSSGNSRHANIRQFLRNTGSLGLSKAELDARCKPSGLYPNCAWDEKQIRRLIGDGKLAARLKGAEVRRQEADTECPICFLNYAQVNQTKCCQASLCTECYLQVRPPREKVVCPFCNSPNLIVTLQQKLSAEAIRERQLEEQRAAEAASRSRSDSKTEEQAPGFGSSLAMDDHVALMRKRSSSMSDASDADLSNLAMTVDERQALEARLRTQQQSPLIQRMQQEELERAFQNERQYLEQNAGRLRRSTVGRGGRRHRDWNRLIQAIEEGGGIQSMDDLAMLEAAMRMAAMENEAQHRGRNDDTEEGGPSPLRRRMLESRAQRATGSASNGPLPGGGFLGGSAIASQLIMRGMTEEEQLAMAIAASLAETNASNESAPADNGDAEESPDAAENNNETAENIEEATTGASDDGHGDVVAGSVNAIDEGSANDAAATHSDTVAESTSTVDERAEAVSGQPVNSEQPGLVDLDVSFSESTYVVDAVEENVSSPAALVDAAQEVTQEAHHKTDDDPTDTNQSSTADGLGPQISPRNIASEQREENSQVDTTSVEAAEQPPAGAVVSQAGLSEMDMVEEEVCVASTDTIVQEVTSSNGEPRQAYVRDETGKNQEAVERNEAFNEALTEEIASNEFKSPEERKMSEEIVSEATAESQESEDIPVETTEMPIEA